MNSLNKEIRIKLDLLESLARSQKALTRMIESVADVVGSSENVAIQLAENIEVLAKYQRALTNKLTGGALPQKRCGQPAKPWLSRQVNDT